MQNRETPDNRETSSTNLSVDELLRSVLAEIISNNDDLTLEEKLAFFAEAIRILNRAQNEQAQNEEQRVQVMEDDEEESDNTQALPLAPTNQERRLANSLNHSINPRLQINIDSSLFYFALANQFSNILLTDQPQDISSAIGRISFSVAMRLHFHASAVDISNQQTSIVHHHPDPLPARVNQHELQGSYSGMIRWPDEASSVERFLHAVVENNRLIIDRYLHEHANESYFYESLSRAMHAAQDAGHEELAAQLSQLITDMDAAKSTDNKPTLELLNKSERRLKCSGFEGEVPAPLCCPVASVIFAVPVTIASGITLELTTLEKLFMHDDDIACPFTKKRISTTSLVNTPNICLSAYVEAFINAAGELPLSTVEALLTCPLTNALFVDPVSFTCGLTLERAAILKRFAEDPSAPFTTIIVNDKQYTIHREELSNFTTIAIQDLVESYKIALTSQGTKSLTDNETQLESVSATNLGLFNPSSNKNSNHPFDPPKPK